MFPALYEEEFNDVPVILPAGNDYFLGLIKSNRLLKIKITNINLNFMLPVISVTENEELNTAWHHVWNSDQSGLREVVLKAEQDGDLSGSPILKTILAIPEVHIVEVKFYDSILQKPITRNRNMLDKFEVRSIDLQTENVTAFEEISNTIQNNRSELRKMVVVAGYDA